MKSKKLLVVSCLLLVIGLLPRVTAIAQSPEATPITNEEVEEIREAVKEKVREKVEAAKTGEKRALVGELTEIFNNTLVLDTRSGEQRAQVATDAAIISEGEDIEFDALEIGSFLICMGYLRSDEILDARRVVVEEEEEAPLERVIAYGEVAEIDEEEETITVKPLREDASWMIKITNKTEITQKIEGEIEEIDFDDISVGDRLVAIGTLVEGEENTITATLIFKITRQAEEVEEAEEPSPTPTEVEEEVEEETPEE